MKPERREVRDVYSEGRYFTVTGQHVAGTPTHDRGTHRRPWPSYMRASSQRLQREPAEGATHPMITVDDAALLAKAIDAKNGARSLRCGQATPALTTATTQRPIRRSVICWRSGPIATPAGLIALFRQSGLMRPKWDERRGAQTYGELTIARAHRELHRGLHPATRGIAAHRDGIID